MSDYTFGLFGKLNEKVNNFESGLKDKAKKEAHDLFHKIANGHHKQEKTDDQAGTESQKQEAENVDAATPKAEIKLDSQPLASSKEQTPLNAQATEKPEIRLSRTLDLQPSPEAKSNPQELVLPPLSFESANNTFKKGHDTLDLEKYGKIQVPETQGLFAKAEESTSQVQLDKNLAKLELKPFDSSNQMFIRKEDPTSVLGFRYEANPGWKAPQTSIAEGQDKKASETTQPLAQSAVDVKAGETNKTNVQAADKTISANPTVKDQSIAPQSKQTERGETSSIQTASKRVQEKEVTHPVKAHPAHTNTSEKTNTALSQKKEISTKAKSSDVQGEKKEKAEPEKNEAFKGKQADKLQAEFEALKKQGKDVHLDNVGSYCAELIVDGKVTALLRQDGSIRRFEYKNNQMVKYTVEYPPSGQTAVYERQADANGKLTDHWVNAQNQKDTLDGKIFVRRDGTFAFLNEREDGKEHPHWTLYAPGEEVMRNVTRNEKTQELITGIMKDSLEPLMSKHSMLDYMKDAYNVLGMDELKNWYRSGNLSDGEALTAAILMKYMADHREGEFHVNTLQEPQWFWLPDANRDKARQDVQNYINAISSFNLASDFTII